MNSVQKKPTTINEYISGFPPNVRAILVEVREVVRSAAPDAEETISYGMPTFMLNGVLVHFAAFKKHIGLFPPMSGNKALQRAILLYAGPKGNLRFPIDHPMPCDLIEKIVKMRVKQNRKQVAQKKANSPRPSPKISTSVDCHLA